MRWSGYLPIFILSGGFLAGCHAPAAPTSPTAMVLRIPDYDQFIDETLTILRERDFRPDHVDRERGIITTGPTTSAQWFEFWRSDTPSGYETLESSMHTIRRDIRIDIEYVGTEPPASRAPASPGQATPRPAQGPATGSDERYRVTVQVDKARCNTSARQVTTASGALAIYSEHLPTEEGLRRATPTDVQWTPLGRDGELEATLLARIADAAPGVEPAD